MLTHLLEKIGPSWRHRLMKQMGLMHAHDDWLGGYCCIEP